LDLQKIHCPWFRLPARSSLLRKYRRTSQIKSQKEGRFFQPLSHFLLAVLLDENSPKTEESIQQKIGRAIVFEKPIGKGVLLLVTAGGASATEKAASKIMVRHLRKHRKILQPLSKGSDFEVATDFRIRSGLRLTASLFILGRDRQSQENLFSFVSSTSSPPPQVWFFARSNDHFRIAH